MQQSPLRGQAAEQTQTNPSTSPEPGDWLQTGKAPATPRHHHPNYTRPWGKKAPLCHGLLTEQVAKPNHCPQAVWQQSGLCPREAACRVILSLLTSVWLPESLASLPEEWWKGGRKTQPLSAILTLSQLPAKAISPLGKHANDRSHSHLQNLRPVQRILERDFSIHSGHSSLMTGFTQPSENHCCKEGNYFSKRKTPRT